MSEEGLFRKKFLALPVLVFGEAGKAKSGAQADNCPFGVSVFGAKCPIMDTPYLLSVLYISWLAVLAYPLLLFWQSETNRNNEQNMDRVISKTERQKVQRKKWLKYGIIAVPVVVAIVLLGFWMKPSVDMKDILIAAADKGNIEVSVNGSGRVVPAVEEVIVTPISSRILEVYKRGGDSVDVGTPILKLDLASTETEYNKMLDQLEMKKYEIEQLKARTHSSLSDMEMRVKVGEMQTRRKQVEMRNEKYLDSIGAGTQDRVREMELSYNVSALEQEQLQKQLANSRTVADAELKVKMLELRIFQKSVAEMKRILDDAQIRSPRKAVLTFINTQVGTQVPAGTQVAIISDLSHFKVECEIADAYSDRVRTGSKVIVRVGKTPLTGIVGSVTPMSKNGVISFMVQLDEDAHSVLRSGLRADVHVLTSEKEDVVRIANGTYYAGAGIYNLFVLDGKNTLVRRVVKLGESNFSHVEVVSGLQPGDKVVVSDMKQYENRSSLSLKQ